MIPNVLLGLGAALLTYAAVALALLPGRYARLHALALSTSAGAPLIAVAAAVDTGVGRAAVKLLFVGALLVVSGPVTSMAVGRVTAQRAGRTGTDRAEAGEEPS
ncbi:monovalent cation/H(+) antiporter subunit G [Streptomyces sp. A7024]|uniref:Monovalent cation/H(+) antiporter subunit G n=1 Tax=Streptomyces coryli TaxID=1128680 RepID=A0A6G4U9Q1_9ACTN|nr:monovalent cation/H(+) antiporter subunit G [Streptomyces coryli]NGN68853.1 monovalent cation/H(+) antiporter subunit G [Streptomyces coryli]